MVDRFIFPAHRADRLNDTRRLQEQVSEKELAALLDLHGGEDIADLGSGTGFYTDRMAALTTGRVYAVEIQPELNVAYQKRGLPPNVGLVLGDITALSLPPASVDVACTIATWHEVGEKFDLPGLLEILRPKGRLVVIDWRRDTESPGSGPPIHLRFTKEEVAATLEPFFTEVSSHNVGRFMFAVVARREAPDLEVAGRAPDDLA
jgi:SAM-dependent methyltransferase